MIREMDYVELITRVDQWPAGTTGIVLDVNDQCGRGTYITVEISPHLQDPATDLLDALIDVPESWVKAA